MWLVGCGARRRRWGQRARLLGIGRAVRYSSIAVFHHRWDGRWEDVATDLGPCSMSNVASHSIHGQGTDRLLLVISFLTPAVDSAREAVCARRYALADHQLLGQGKLGTKTADDQLRA